MALDPLLVRLQFPALQKSTAIFLDNPAGTQICEPALKRMVDYLTTCNANHEGAFATSRQSDALLWEAHAAVADFYNAARPEEMIFGANMTTLTFHLSRSLARWLQAGDRIVVTRLDHDANISPWLLIAEERGCIVDWVDFCPEEGTLRLDEMRRALERQPRLVAVGYASNALGTINPLPEIVPMAKQAGALVYVDAVQYAPHGPIDVQALGCDFLVSSAYKWFGPHVGVLYGRYELLEALVAYKVRPAPSRPPGKFETGTLNHEGIVGVLGAIEYLEALGETYGAEFEAELAQTYQGRRLRLKKAMSVIRQYEAGLTLALLETLEGTPGITIYGLRDPKRLSERVPTVAFRLKGWHPRHVAEELDKAGIYVWDGNYYALAVTTRLGVEEDGGMVRVGAVHYNTVEEIERFGEALRRLIH
ncbi:MAG: cysteine desulfurase-like protein [Anaerolineales bacterium]|nr:cysteine desulfurase-like protein [Anaerolineales bacterium]MDW8161485.1 cysteine desulfurase-like protein [Anaerolineales bacterium]